MLAVARMAQVSGLLDETLEVDAEGQGALSEEGMASSSRRSGCLPAPAMEETRYCSGLGGNPVCGAHPRGGIGRLDVERDRDGHRDDQSQDRSGG